MKDDLFSIFDKVPNDVRDVEKLDSEIDEIPPIQLCGRAHYLEQRRAILPESITAFVLRLLLAGMVGCVRGCVEECNNPTQRNTLLNHNIMLHTAYGSVVNTGTLTLDGVRIIGGRRYRIKIVDAKAHNLDPFENYRVQHLLKLDAVTIDAQENAYLAYCKVVAMAVITGKDEEMMRAASKIDTDGALRSRAVAEFPILFSDNADSDIATVKNIYHKILIQMAPVDVFHSVYKFLEFVFENLGIESLSSRHDIVCLVNVPNLENAFWTGSYAVFGNGDKSLYPLASTDVIGHEMAHGLVEDLIRLEYRGDCGAINESFADVLGSLFEMYMFSETLALIWETGERSIGGDIMKTGTRDLRDFADPHKSFIPQPKLYRGKYYVNPESGYDRGGIHINSGLSNHLFYLVATKLDASEALLLYKKAISQLGRGASFVDFAATLKSVALTPIIENVVKECLGVVGLDLNVPVVDGLCSKIQRVMRAARSARK